MVVLTILLALMVSFSASAKTMYVKVSGNLYKKNHTKSTVLASLDAGTKVNVGAKKKGWAKVKVDGKVGFMLASGLTSSKPTDGSENELQSVLRYVVNKCKLHKGASAASKSLATLAAGSEVALKKVSGKWGKVVYSGKTGYVKVANLSETAPTSSEKPTEEASDKDNASDKYPTLSPGDTGDAVKKLQTRLKALEWFYGDIGGNYKDLTTQAVKDFQKAAGLSQTGIADNATQVALYKSNAPKNTVESTAKPASGKSKEMDWWTSGIQTIFPRGATAVVTDVKTGLSWQVYRSGGTNHADVQPKTAADTAVMNKAYGGAWSWNRRAIWVSIGGNKYAASMNGMPHGSGSIPDNGFNGHHCIHFTNSRTHGSNSVDENHQRMVAYAASAA